jgi:DNA-binding transcriptional regulator YhcF (GntR family)
MTEEFLKFEVRDIRDSDWYWISRSVLEDFAQKIGVIGLALYNLYASYAREKGMAFPSQETVAKTLEISIPTLIKYNKILEENGLIKIERRKNEGKTNIIYLLKLFKEGSKTALDGGLKEFKTKENNIKENTNVDDKSSAIDVIEYFRKRVKELKGFEPEIDWGKDGGLAKNRLKKYSFEEIKELIDWYLNSNHFERFGASLSICLSAFMINLWKASKSGQISIEALYPAWKHQL